MPSLIAEIGVTMMLAMFAGAAAARPAPPPVLAGGAEAYQDSHVDGDIQCVGLPVVLAGSHTSLRLFGNCGRVVVAGEHNDISVRVSPGAIIEITGAHNDVTWIPTRRGPPPALIDRGSSNTFHYADH